MLKLFKKLFPPKPDPTPILNETLIERLSSMMYYHELQALFFSPECKLYILTMYTTSFQELLENFYNQQYQKNYSAINIHSYFKGLNSDLSEQIEKLIKALRTTKVNALIEHDLLELVSAFDYFLELEL